MLWKINDKVLVKSLSGWRIGTIFEITQKGAYLTESDDDSINTQYSVEIDDTDDFCTFPGSKIIHFMKTI